MLTSSLNHIQIKVYVEGQLKTVHGVAFLLKQSDSLEGFKRQQCMVTKC